MAGGAAESGRSVTSKVTAILMVFSRGDAYSLTELARLAGLPVSTAHRLAGELTARRLLERTDDGGYRIGLPLRVIGAGVVGAGTSLPEPGAAVPGLLDVAIEVMTDLALATRSTVRIGVLDGAAVAAATVGSDGPVPTALESLAGPVGGTALDRVLLAFSPSEVDAVLGRGAAADRVRRTLGPTRVSRNAVSRGPVPSAGAVAMPVFGAGGVLIAALELHVPNLASGLRGGRAALAVATGSLSRQLATAAGDHAVRDQGPQDRGPISSGTSAVAYHS